MKKVFILLKYQESEELDIFRVYKNLPSVTSLVDLLDITPEEAKELIDGEEILVNDTTEYTVYLIKEYSVEEE